MRQPLFYRGSCQDMTQQVERIVTTLFHHRNQKREGKPSDVKSRILFFEGSDGATSRFCDAAPVEHRAEREASGGDRGYSARILMAVPSSAAPLRSASRKQRVETLCLPETGPHGKA